MAAADIFDRLMLDHNNHRRWIEELLETQGDSKERRDTFKQLKLDITAHAAAEEEVFYTRELAISELRESGRDGVAEHKEIAEMLIELEEMDFSSTGWLNRFHTFREKYMHHIDEEDEEKFPELKEKISKAEAVRMRDEFEDRKPEEVGRAKTGVDDKAIKKEMEGKEN